MENIFLLHRVRVLIFFSGQMSGKTLIVVMGIVKNSSNQTSFYCSKLHNSTPIYEVCKKFPTFYEL